MAVRWFSTTEDKLPPAQPPGLEAEVQARQVEEEELRGEFNDALIDALAGLRLKAAPLAAAIKARSEAQAGLWQTELMLEKPDARVILALCLEREMVRLRQEVTKELLGRSDSSRSTDGA